MEIEKPPELRMYVVVSQEAFNLMKPQLGKLTAQTAHAFLHAYWDAEERFPEAAHSYRHGDQSAVKITLVAPGDSLKAIAEHYRETHGVTVVTDAGRTVFDGPTLTCIGIGPISKEESGDVLGHLSMLKR